MRRRPLDVVATLRVASVHGPANRLHNLRKEVREFYWGHRVNPDILELRNLVATASLVVDCAIRRKGSRGIHYTLDCPEPNDRYRANTVLPRF